MKKQIKILFLAGCLSLLFSAQAFAGWVQTETGQWNYDQYGVTLKNQWHKDQGRWYYLDADGIMFADTVQNIDGVNYAFDASGKWVESILIQTGVDGMICTNTDAGYSVQIPEGFKINLPEDDYLSIKGMNNAILFAHADIPKGDDVNKYVDAFIAGFVEEEDAITHDTTTYTQLGDFIFKKIHCTYDDQIYDIINIDLHTQVQDQTLYSVTSVYLSEDKAVIQDILNTLKKTP